MNRAPGKFVTDRRRSRWNGILPVALVLLCTLACLQPLIATQQTAALRDQGHYYYPLYSSVQERWRRREVPLWTWSEDTGHPLLADMTAGALYPGRICFWLPLPYPAQWNLFLIAHVVLAGCGVVYVGWRWRWHPAATALAAVGYALGGSVVSQHANPPYLVGACWLPWLLVDLQRGLHTGRLETLALAAFWWALILLGGDLQTAYHAGLAAILLAFLLGVRRSVRVLPRERFRRWITLSKRLTTMVLITCGLAAAQLLPSYEFSQLCDRAQPSDPRSIVAQYPGKPDAVAGDAAAQPSDSSRDRAGHERIVYEFSVGPWRWAELIWPGFAGRAYPQNRRWLSALPAEQLWWSPDLYLGIVVLLLACQALTLDRGSPRRRWLTWLAAGSLLAALGQYGLAWWTHEFALWLGRPVDSSTALHPATGGVYWWCRLLLPGYANFRYPAKWLVVTQLAVCLLAGTAANRKIRAADPWPLLGGALVMTLSLCGWCVLSFGWQWWIALLERQQQVDPVWGLLDAAGGLRDLQSGFLHTFVVLAVAATAITGFRHRPHSTPRLVWCLALLTAADLTMAHRWMIVTVPSETLAGATSRLPASPHNASMKNWPLRYYRLPNARRRPALWSLSREGDRLTEVVRWDQNTAAPKYHLMAPSPWSLVGGRVSVRAGSVAEVLWAGGLERDVPANAPNSPDAEQQRRTAVALQLLGVERQLTVQRNTLSSLPPDAPERTADAAIVWNDPPLPVLPRAWIAREARRAASDNRLADADRPSWIGQWMANLQPDDLTSAVWLAPDVPDSLYEITSVDHDQRGEISPSSTTEDDPSMRSGFVLPVRGQPERTLLFAQMNEPGWVVLNDLAYPGWEVSVTNLSTDQRTPANWVTVNAIMRGIHLPAGTYLIDYRYRPVSWRYGLPISLLTLCILFLARPARCTIQYLQSLRRTC